MDKKQIELVKGSWAILEPVRQHVGELFYEKLFLVTPDVKYLFGTDIKTQAARLITMLNYVVERLDAPEALAGELHRIGTRHRSYGAKPGHFIAVGRCLLATLQEVLGPVWNEDLRQAWVEAYSMIAGGMTRTHQVV